MTGTKNEQTTEKTLDRTQTLQNVSELLFRLGISPGYKGFGYAVCAVSLCREQWDRLSLVTKWLYPDIAKKFGTNWQAVERDLRTVSRLAWVRNRSLLESAAKRPLPRYPRTVEFLTILCNVSMVPTPHYTLQP